MHIYVYTYIHTYILTLTFLPYSALRLAAARPPEPPPMTIRSYLVVAAVAAAAAQVAVVLEIPLRLTCEGEPAPRDSVPPARKGNTRDLVRSILESLWLTRRRLNSVLKERKKPGANE